jgi:hypothetical protein
MLQMNDKHNHAETSIIITPVQTTANGGESGGGVSTTTLFILLLLSSILSSVLNPFVQTSLKCMIEIYIDLPPNAVNQYQQRQQQQQEETLTTPVSPAAIQSFGSSMSLMTRAHPLKSQFGCKHNYQTFMIIHNLMVIYLEDFLQPGEAEHMIEVTKSIMTRPLTIGDDEPSDGCTSNTTYLEFSHDAAIRYVEKHASLFSNISIESTKPLQVIWYTKG